VARWLWGDTERRLEQVAAFPSRASCVEVAQQEARTWAEEGTLDALPVVGVSPWPEIGRFVVVEPVEPHTTPPRQPQTRDTRVGRPSTVMGWSVSAGRGGREGWREDSYQCWPDTVDPRGLKGGGR
jgi:hypothetical protein